MDNKNLWYGYQHINGKYQVKRYFDGMDIIEASQSPFVRVVYGSFEAKNREEAIKILKENI